ncbi:hypothetical protein F5X96DRAFT_628361 [Biscogniauxia mediterranea]|nr:hypothetical protein F5X96DRAFT_628361 [Biscogniauxia mediterranea]
MTDIEHVEVKQSQIAGAGRGLFARKDFAPGDLVLAIDRPLVAEPEVERMLDTCAWCFQRGATDPVERARAASMGMPTGVIEVKSCTGCRRVGYCSKTCQAKAWKREHKYECKILAPKDQPDLPVHVRAVIKLLGRLQADPEGKNGSLLDILKFRPAGEPSALHEFSQQDPKRFDDFKMLGHAVWKYCGEPKLENMDAQAASRALLINVMCNCFELSSGLDDIHLGIGFDPLVSSANHSCDPNAVQVFNQPETILRAIKPIKKGDEIFLKYTDVTNPFSVRQADLKKTHLFTCQCSKCKQGAVLAQDTFLHAPEKLPSEHCQYADSLIGRHEPQLSRYSVPGEDATAKRRLAILQAEAFTVAEKQDSGIEDIRKALQMCITSGMWSWTRQPVPRLARRLFGLYLDSGEPYKAFRMGIKMYFDMDPKLTPQEFYPDRLTHAWVLSTITNVLCGPAHREIYQEFAQAGLDLRIVYFGFLFDVYDHLPRMYGRDSPLGLVVKNTYDQLMAGIGFSESQLRDTVKSAWPALEAVAQGLEVASL